MREFGYLYVFSRQNPGQDQGVESGPYVFVVSPIAIATLSGKAAPSPPHIFPFNWGCQGARPPAGGFRGCPPELNIAPKAHLEPPSGGLGVTKSLGNTS